MPFPKIVDSSHYHIWTDALHARELARQAENRWDRGVYVRWAITTGWTALEIACEDALNETGIGRRFKDNLNKAVKAKGLSALDWGTGVWHDILDIHKLRKEFVHFNLDQEKLFPEVQEAEKAITTLREAIKDIYRHSGKPFPDWVVDDEDKGWAKSNGISAFSHATLIPAGVERENPKNIIVAYVHKDREHTDRILPPGTDYTPIVEELKKGIRIPITAIKVYCGNQLIDEYEFNWRGA